MDAHAAQTPVAAYHRQQPVAVLVKHPQPHPLGADGHFGETLGERKLKDFSRQRVFFGVGLARHFQDPADFSKQGIYAA